MATLKETTAFTLTLSHDEACALQKLLYVIGGETNKTRRLLMGISDALDEVCNDPQNCGNWIDWEETARVGAIMCSRDD